MYLPGATKRRDSAASSADAGAPAQSIAASAAKEIRLRRRCVIACRISRAYAIRVSADIVTALRRLVWLASRSRRAAKAGADARTRTGTGLLRRDFWALSICYV